MEKFFFYREQWVRQEVDNDDDDGLFITLNLENEHVEDNEFDDY